MNFSKFLDKYLKVELLPVIVLPLFIIGILYSVFLNYPYLQGNDYVALIFACILGIGTIIAVVNYILLFKKQ